MVDALEKQIVNPHTALGREDLQRLQALRFDAVRETKLKSLPDWCRWTFEHIIFWPDASGPP
jgi:hypothetical protein